MTGLERVQRAIEYRNPDRIPQLSPIPAFSDFFYMLAQPASDWQPQPGNGPHIPRELLLMSNWKWKAGTPQDFLNGWFRREDEFGCVWESNATDNLGEVTGNPLASIEDAASYPFPDPHRPERFEAFERLTKIFGRDKFILGELGNGIWERTHFLRGFSGAMEDLALRPEAVGALLDRLLDEWQIGLVEEYASRGCHGVIFPDDWGTQDRLMVSPAMWRKVFKPRYARLFEAVHMHGMKVFMHSCGQITAVLDDLVEIGLDVIQKDDIECLGSKEMGERYAGKLCFLTSLDLQRTLPRISETGISSHVQKLIRNLGSNGGGLMAMTYMQPGAIGISWLKMGLMAYYFALYGRYGVHSFAGGAAH